MKECTNCEGEGRVVIWGYYGHEVPASRVEKYPLDRPACYCDGQGRPYACPECRGTGDSDWRYQREREGGEGR